MLVEASTTFIEKTYPLSRVRERADRPADGSTGLDAAYLEAAANLGWFGLLVDEARGGGSASGNGLLDAAAIAAERGAALQPGPIIATTVVAHALADAGPAHETLLADLVAGRASAAWIAGAGAEAAPGADEVRALPDGDGYRLDGTVRPVVDAVGCDHWLVTARASDGLVQFLVDPGAPGVEVAALESLDLTRRSTAVVLRGVRVDRAGVLAVPGPAVAAQVERQALSAAVLLAAESVGAMHQEFTLALEYAKTRIAFGRPIGSFQAVKHQLADLSLALEMAKGLVAAAATSLGAGQADGGELAHAAKVFVAERGIDLAHGCFQILGGIGYTWEHDHHLFMRRLAADAVAFGSADWHRRRLAERIEAT